MNDGARRSDMSCRGADDGDNQTARRRMESGGGMGSTEGREECKVFPVPRLHSKHRITG